MDEFHVNSINQRTYTGNSISIYNGRVTIDGVAQDDKVSGVVEVRVVEGVLGELRTDAAVSCGQVSGSVTAGGSVSCGDVSGDVDAGGSVNCDAVDGNVDAGGSVNCDRVGGSVSAGGSVRHR